MRRTLTLVSAVLLCCQAFAAEPIKSSNNQLSLSIGREKIDYTETQSGAWLDSENGTINKGILGYTVQGDVGGVSNIYFQGSFGYGQGETKYDGGLQSWNGSSWTVTPYQATTHVTNNDLSLKLGKGFSFASNRFQLTPLLAYDYHQWERNVATWDVGGYKEVYEHQALSMGLLGQMAVTDRLVLSAYGSYGKIIRARMEVEHDATFKLQGRPITNLGLNLDYRLTDAWRLNAGYQWVSYKYGESDVVQGWIEPDSKTKLQSFYVGGGYSF